MIKTYLFKGKKVNFFENNLANNMSYWDEKQQKDIYFEIQLDEQGKAFFEIENEKIYVEDNLTYTLEECQELAKKRSLKSHDFVNMALKIGVENVHLIIGCKKHLGYFGGFIANYSDELYEQECFINENYPMREMKNNYKVYIECLDSNYKNPGDWYLMDLVSFINDGLIKIKKGEIGEE